MEKIQINMNSPQRAIRELTPTDITMGDDELLITLKGKECYNIDAGQIFIFKRYFYKEDGTMSSISEEGEVLYEDENHIIHVSLPKCMECNVTNVDLNTGTTISSIGSPVFGMSYSGASDFVVLTTSGHTIFPQDLDMGQELYLYDKDDNLIVALFPNEFAIPNKYSFLPVNKDECLIYEETVDCCNPLVTKCNSITTYGYVFLPESVSTTKIIIDKSIFNTSGATLSDLERVKYIKTKFNSYFYFDDKKKCYLYGDPWWSEFKNSETNCTKYVNCGATRTIIGVNDAYWNVGIDLSQDCDTDALGSEDSYNSNFVQDVEDSIVPDIIDMERIKYSPIITDLTSVSAVTSLTFDFHFRERVPNKGKNSSYTKNNYFADGWYIDVDEACTKWWYNCPKNVTEPTTITGVDMTTFIADYGAKSDLLGLLNFTDSDVYYRKKKVTQSFIRLSYYDKKNEDEEINALNERLLYYSTVFLDGGKLYGKYVKQLMNIEECTGTVPYDLITAATDTLNVVFCNASARVDSEIVITNEYDRESSAEGFNIYLFKEDAPTEENPEKTIYMKVEFNHAGNGKTIPMILESMWPKDTTTGNYVSLKTDNYLESLYIPIVLRYLNGKYYYTIPNAKDENDGNIRFILLEPKLDV